MRSMWKGNITFSLVNIPINVYNAVESEDKISFNQFHKEDYGRVGYEKKCKTCNKALGEDDIIKGYEHDKNQFVYFEPGELENLKVPSQNTIEITGFVDIAQINPLFFEKPYYLAPQNDGAAKGYGLLVRTIQKSGKLAIAKVSIRQKEDFVLLSPMENVLVMYKIRYPNEIRNVGEVPGIKNNIEVKKGEIDLAEKLVESMSISIDEVEVVDQYQLELKKLVEAKLAGKVFKQPEIKQAAATPDLMAALKQSLANKNVSKKPMQKSTGTKKSKTLQRKQA